ncbi:MAG TPA: ATP phosphoribosyltransferase regulatory subunit [Devosiaceae bacterium]
MTNPAARQQALARLLESEGARVTPPLLLPAGLYFDLAGEEFGRRLLLTSGGDGTEFCLRPDFTLPIVADYLKSPMAGQPAAFGYLGPIFRQRSTGILEADQAGLELLAQPDPDAALDRVFGFARKVLDIFGVANPVVRLGGVALFERLLAELDMPDVWRPRIRNRFGHDEALARLLARLGAPATGNGAATDRASLVEQVTEQMLGAGLSLTEGRSPGEIADRYLEQQALDAALVPAASLGLLRDYLAIGGAAGEALDAVEALAKRAGFDLSAPLTTLHRHLMAFGPAAPVTFEAAFSPRLDYYTGVVFEITGEGGHVLASGGQYDRLLERLGAQSRIAASGCAVWVDRLEREAAR